MSPLRVCFVSLLFLLPCAGEGTPEPGAGYACFFDERKDRVAVLIDPALGTEPKITRFTGEQVRGAAEGTGDIVPPSPINEAGLYEYPSFKLVYALEGWSHKEWPHFAGTEMRFILRDVWDPPEDKNADGAPGNKKPKAEDADDEHDDEVEIKPPGVHPTQWPAGLALYDEGKLVHYFPPEELYLDHRKPGSFSLKPGECTYKWRFDEEEKELTIQTKWRGYNLLWGFPPWYSESYLVDAHTGDVKKTKVRDYLQFVPTGIAGMVFVGIMIWLWVKKRRKKRGPQPPPLPLPRIADGAAL